MTREHHPAVARMHAIDGAGTWRTMPLRFSRSTLARMRYRAVFFDAGGTLFSHCPGVSEVIAGLLQERGFDVSAAEIAGHVAEFTDRAARRALRIAAWRKATGRSSRPASAEETASSWAEIYDGAVVRAGVPIREPIGRLVADALARSMPRLFPDVLPALDMLRSAGLVLGVISNFALSLGELLDSLGLSPYFTVRAVSGEDLVAKPDVRLFQHALARTGAPPQAAAHVGDDPWFDAAPATEAGMSAILLDRAHRYASHQGLRIASLTELPTALGL
jgi:putative hydrolase of the HAD superfamily